MVVKDSEINFISAKIDEIGYALFSSDLEPEFCLFNNIIKTLKTSNGTIWFFTSCKAECITSLKGEFFASLNYYQKGKNFRLHVTGKASIAESMDDIAYTGVTNTQTVLIKYKIDKAEYFEYNTGREISFTKKLKKCFDSFLFPNSHRLYDFTSFGRARLA